MLDSALIRELKTDPPLRCALAATVAGALLSLTLRAPTAPGMTVYSSSTPLTALVQPVQAPAFEHHALPPVDAVMPPASVRPTPRRTNP